MIGYVDSSVVLRLLLGQGVAGLPSRVDVSELHTSRLTPVECRRTIDRLMLTGEVSPERVLAVRGALLEAERSLSLHQLSEAVLDFAAMPMGSVVGTLDAIHIATAFLLRESAGQDVVFLTFDIQQARVAKLLDFPVAGVETAP